MRASVPRYLPFMWTLSRLPNITSKLLHPSESCKCNFKTQDKFIKGPGGPLSFYWYNILLLGIYHEYIWSVSIQALYHEECFYIFLCDIKSFPTIFFILLYSYNNVILLLWIYQEYIRTVSKECFLVLFYFHLYCDLTWQSCCILLDFRKKIRSVSICLWFLFLLFFCDIRSYPTIFLYSFGWSSLQPLHQPYKTSLQTLCFTFLALLYNLKRPLQRCLLQSGMWLTGDGIANAR